MVIQNYLSNAIKHAFINSTIKIKIKENEFSIENKGNKLMKIEWTLFGNLLSVMIKKGQV